jgi:microcystin-dependent protein
MSEPFVGQITMFAGNFAPRGWAYCDGQLLAISQNDVLFSLLGTIYGGDGRTTFGLPDLRGRVPIHVGQGPGLTNRPIGAKSGSETVTVTTNQMPAHNHALNASTDPAGDTSPVGNVTATSTGASIYGGTGTPVDLATSAVANTGGSQPHSNVMPFLCVSFIIALFGIYPSRN